MNDKSDPLPGDYPRLKQVASESSWNVSHSMLAPKFLNRLEYLLNGHWKSIDRNADWGCHEADIHLRQSCLETSHSRNKVIGSLDRDRNKSLTLHSSRKNPIDFFPADEPGANCRRLIGDSLDAQDQRRLSNN